MAALIATLYPTIIRPAITALFGLAFVFFIFGMARFVKESDSDEGRETGRRTVIFGLLGMLIMVSFLGIINIIAGTLGVTVPPVLEKVQEDIDKIDVKTEL